MKRRSFVKGMATAGAGFLLPPGVMLSSCSGSKTPDMSWNFDEVQDRTGTWSIKYSRAVPSSEGAQTPIPMWIADMDFKTDPVVAKALKDRIDKDVMGYTMTPSEYIDAIVSWVKAMHGYKVDREWVSNSPGVITSINQAYLSFTSPGDRIVVQPPVYDPFKMFIGRLGRIPVDNPLIEENGRYRMDFDGLESLFKDGVKAMVLCNPQNPVGILWDKDTLSRLADLCDRYGVVVFSDEIHSDLALWGRKHIPFCSVSEAAARVGLIFCGPTKSFNLAGLSWTSWCIIPDKEKRERYLNTLHSAKLSESSVLSMVATIAAYTHEPVWLNDLKKYLEGNINLVKEFFDENDLGIKAVVPEASFLVWLDCRALGMEQDALMKRFGDSGVVFNNGASYGPGGEGFARMNVGCPRSVLKEALERIKKGF